MYFNYENLEDGVKIWLKDFYDPFLSGPDLIADAVYVAHLEIKRLREENQQLLMNTSNDFEKFAHELNQNLLCNEIDKLKSTIEDIDLESSRFGRHYGFVYNNVATGQKVIIVNKDRAVKSKEGASVLTHEWLHFITNDIIHNTNF